MAADGTRQLVDEAEDTSQVALLEESSEAVAAEGEQYSEQGDIEYADEEEDAGEYEAAYDEREGGDEEGIEGGEDEEHYEEAYAVGLYCSVLSASVVHSFHAFSDFALVTAWTARTSTSRRSTPTKKRSRTEPMRNKLKRTFRCASTLTVVYSHASYRVVYHSDDDAESAAAPPAEAPTLHRAIEQRVRTATERAEHELRALRGTFPVVRLLFSGAPLFSQRVSSFAPWQLRPLCRRPLRLIFRRRRSKPASARKLGANTLLCRARTFLCRSVSQPCV